LSISRTTNLALLTSNWSTSKKKCSRMHMALVALDQTTEISEGKTIVFWIQKANNVCRHLLTTSIMHREDKTRILTETKLE